MTLNDLKRHNSPNLCVISPNSVAFVAGYVKVVEGIRYFLRQKCSLKNAVYSDISLTAILAGESPLANSDSVKVRHSPLARENLTNNQPQP